jgi:hypothetical protein
VWRSRIAETGIGLEVKIKARLVLKCQSFHLAISLAHHDYLGRDGRRDLELLGKLFFIPNLPVDGFKGLAILPDLGAVRLGLSLSCCLMRTPSRVLRGCAFLPDKGVSLEASPQKNLRGSLPSQVGFVIGVPVFRSRAQLLRE